MADNFRLNFPIETDDAWWFWESKHRLNRIKAIIAFSLDEDNANDNLRRFGYYRQYRKRYLDAYGSIVNNPGMSGVPRSGLDDLWYDPIPISAGPIKWTSTAPVGAKIGDTYRAMWSGGTAPFTVVFRNASTTYQTYVTNSRSQNVLMDDNAGTITAGNYFIDVTDNSVPPVKQTLSFALATRPAQPSPSPIITAQPSAPNVVEPKPFTVSMTVTGTGTLTIDWFEEDATAAGGWKAVPAAHNLQTWTSPATVAATRTFRAEVTNTEGSKLPTKITTDEVSVVVLPKMSVISNIPTTQTVDEGKPLTATFDIVGGLAPYTYQWYSGAAYPGQAISGMVSNSLSVNPVYADNGHIYYCIATDSDNNTLESAHMAVTVNPITYLWLESSDANITISGTAPTQSATINDNVTAGAQINVRRSIKGTTNPLNNGADGYQVSGGNPAIATVTIEANSSGKTVLARITPVSVGTTTYTFSMPSSVVDNVESVTLTINVTHVIPNPTITTHPADVTAAVGQTTPAVSFTVVANNAVSYEWFHKATTSGATWTALANSNSATYTIPHAIADTDAGDYHVVVTGAAGSTSVTSNDATLTVNANPSIFRGPADVTATEGQTTPVVSFRVLANDAVSYQWFKSTDSGSTWNPIQGATGSVYTFLTAIALSDAGQYRVVVTGATGTTPATSNAATLTVNPKPIVDLVAPSDIYATYHDPNHNDLEKTFMATDTVTLNITANDATDIDIEDNTNVTIDKSDLTAVKITTKSNKATQTVNVKYKLSGVDKVKTVTLHVVSYAFRHVLDPSGSNPSTSVTVGTSQRFKVVSAENPPYNPTGATYKYEEEYKTGHITITPDTANHQIVVVEGVAAGGDGVISMVTWNEPNISSPVTFSAYDWINVT